MRQTLRPIVLIGVMLMATHVEAAGDALPQRMDVLKDFLARPALTTGDVRTSRLEHEGRPALAVEVKRGGVHPWDLGVSWPTPVGLKKGDVLHVTMLVRGSAQNEQGEAMLGVAFERLGEPWTKSMEREYALGREWRRIDIPFRSAEAYAAGKSHLTLRLAYGAQRIEIAEMAVALHGEGGDPATLPRTVLSYRGREEGAAWRVAALARIERLRKQDVTVNVIDADGKPLAGAQVRIRQTLQAYKFGSAVVGAAIVGDRPEHARYREIVLRSFNAAVMENDLKWPGWEGAWGQRMRREQTLEALKWLNHRDIAVRGHVLVWPNWQHAPADVKKLADDKPALRKRIDGRITDAVTATRGLLYEWDVVNEPFANHEMLDVLGREEMVRWFKLAREANPQVRLFLNDYPQLRRRGGAHLDHFEQTLRFLKDAGAPIGGVGIQCHYGENVSPPDELLHGLDRFARLGMPIVCTEYDVVSNDEALQADYLRDHLIAWFSHPATTGFLMWGFWEGAHWRPVAAMYRKDFTPKPAATVWDEWVRRRWMSDEAGRSDASGAFAARVFKGRHEVEVTSGGKSQKSTFEVLDERETITITLR